MPNMQERALSVEFVSGTSFRALCELTDFPTLEKVTTKVTHFGVQIY